MTSTPSDIHARLCAPFDKSEEKERKGPGGKMLTYIDSRAVQERLDAVVGTDGWQSRMVMNGEKVACELSIKFGDAWITKTDGAGETDIEGEKGSFSDAFKRAAVMFGVGRYLYEGKTKQARPRITESIMDRAERSADPDVDAAEMLLRKAMNDMDDGKIETSDVIQIAKDAVFAFDVEEKVRLSGRFNSRERRLMKEVGVDW